jgi:hypothetical protein
MDSLSEYHTIPSECSLVVISFRSVEKVCISVSLCLYYACAICAIACVHLSVSLAIYCRVSLHSSALPLSTRSVIVLVCVCVSLFELVVLSVFLFFPNRFSVLFVCCVSQLVCPCMIVSV